MKKPLLLLGIAAFTCFEATAQCVTIACPPSVAAGADSGTCGTTITYAPPVVTANCPFLASDTFLYTGAAQSFVVPAGIFTLTIETWGAQGGANWVNNVNFGGYTKADFPVTPGETLYIYVGSQPSGITGGYNGGGNGEGAGKGGGGATDVRQGGTALTDRIIVAGGAGGAGYWSSLHVVGGLGGGLTGGDGYRDPNYATNPGGQGGTQTASGTGTCVSFNNPSVSGGFGYGGTPSGCGCEGYGGGGGWYGGAGSGNCRGGGGGSSYLLPAAINTTMIQGGRAGNGMAVISYDGGTTTTSYTQTAGLPSGSVFPVGVTTNTFVGADNMGNTDTCSFTVTVTDSEAPVLTVPSSITQNNDAAQCGANVSWTTPSVVDNCGFSLYSSHNSGDMFPIGTTTVTCIATDPSGNADTATFTVTVIDNEPPFFSGVPATITQGNDAAQCNAVVSWTPPVATDNCSATTTSDYIPGDTFPVGTTTVTYIATDPSGNADTITFDIVVTDTEMPVVSCPADITVSTDAGMCTASGVSLGSASAIDNCSVTMANDAPSIFPAGATVVTWTATDAGGNAVTCTQTVTVVDNEAPVIAGCSADITICPGVIIFNSPTATDNCSGAGVTQVSGPASGSNLSAGTYPVLFVATDSAGNSDSCSFTVTVVANPTVTLSLSTPSTVCLDDASYTLSGGAPAGGTWSGNGVSGNSFDPSVAGNGLQTITYTFTDMNGCDGSATDSVTVSACVGMNEFGQNTFNIFPNPASGAFWFVSDVNGTFELFDLNGKVVLQQKLNAGRNEISAEQLAAGVYNVRFTSAKGISSGRLVIQ